MAQHILNVKFNIWSKENNTLFDYDAENYITSQFQVKGSTKIIRYKNRILESYYAQIKDEGYITDIDYHKREDYFVIRPDNSDTSKYPWIILKYTFDNGYLLRIGDIIKLGKICFLVKDYYKTTSEHHNFRYVKEKDSKRKSKDKGKNDKNKNKSKDKDKDKENNNYNKDNINNNSINTNNQELGNNLKDKSNYYLKSYYEDFRNINNNINNSNLNNNISNTNLQSNENDRERDSAREDNYNSNANKKQKRKKLPLCKICLCEDNTEENPLINPCHCIGSVGLTHLECLRTWLHSKVTKRSAGFLTLIAFKKLSCEICKGKIPEKIKYENKVYSLIQPNNPEKSFIMLEAINKESVETKYIYIIQLEEGEKLTMGRANDSDIKLNDISVSRCHALLCFIDNNFYLKDNSSKFGTLTKLQNPIVALPTQSLFLQYGKFYISYTSVKSCLSFLICKGKNKYSGVDYNELLSREINHEEFVELDYINSSNYYETINSNKLRNEFGIRESEEKRDIDKEKDKKSNTNINNRADVKSNLSNTNLNTNANNVINGNISPNANTNVLDKTSNIPKNMILNNFNNFNNNETMNHLSQFNQPLSSNRVLIQEQGRDIDIATGNLNNNTDKNSIKMNFLNYMTNNNFESRNIYDTGNKYAIQSASNLINNYRVNESNLNTTVKNEENSFAYNNNIKLKEIANKKDDKNSNYFNSNNEYDKEVNMKKDSKNDKNNNSNKRKKSKRKDNNVLIKNKNNHKIKKAKTRNFKTLTHLTSGFFKTNTNNLNIKSRFNKTSSYKKRKNSKFKKAKNMEKTIKSNSDKDKTLKVDSISVEINNSKLVKHAKKESSSKNKYNSEKQQRNNKREKSGDMNSLASFKEQLKLEKATSIKNNNNNNYINTANTKTSPKKEKNEFDPFTFFSKKTRYSIGNIEETYVKNNLSNNFGNNNINNINNEYQNTYAFNSPNVHKTTSIVKKGTYTNNNNYNKNIESNFNYNYNNEISRNLNTKFNENDITSNNINDDATIKSRVKLEDSFTCVDDIDEESVYQGYKKLPYNVNGVELEKGLGTKLNTECTNQLENINNYSNVNYTNNINSKKSNLKKLPLNFSVKGLSSKNVLENTNVNSNILSNATNNPTQTNNKININDNAVKLAIPKHINTTNNNINIYSKEKKTSYSNEKNISMKLEVGKGYNSNQDPADAVFSDAVNVTKPRIKALSNKKVLSNDTTNRNYNNSNSKSSNPIIPKQSKNENPRKNTDNLSIKHSNPIQVNNEIDKKDKRRYSHSKTNNNSNNNNNNNNDQVGDYVKVHNYAIADINMDNWLTSLK